MAIKKETQITQVILMHDGTMRVSYNHQFIEGGEVTGNGSTNETFDSHSDMNGEDPYLQDLMAVVVKWADEDEE